jgi:hypothetical protein
MGDKQSKILQSGSREQKEEKDHMTENNYLARSDFPTSHSNDKDAQIKSGFDINSSGLNKSVDLRNYEDDDE